MSIVRVIFGLFLLMGLVLSMIAVIMVFIRWKNERQRWMWVALAIVGLLPQIPGLIHDPNDNAVARSWVGIYSLPCFPDGKLILDEDSHFRLSTSNWPEPEVGDWSYVFDDEDFIKLEANSGKRIRLRVKGSNQGFEFAKGEYTFDLVRCKPVRR